jgi:DNA-binding LytR/AlgR family response regulator
MCEKTNITYILNEINDEKENIFTFEDILKNFEEIEFKPSNTDEKLLYDDYLINVVNYDLNNTVKQLTLICDFYKLKIPKGKTKKQEIIEKIMYFENDESNVEIVTKRKFLWYCMNELKNNNFMKKYVIWT